MYDLVIILFFFFFTSLAMIFAIFAVSTLQLISINVASHPSHPSFTAWDSELFYNLESYDTLKFGAAWNANIRATTLVRPNFLSIL